MKSVFTTETRRHGESISRSGWIIFVIVVQLLYSLFLIGFPVYLLALGDGWGVIFAAAALGGPGILGLIGWLGLRKGKLWGWLVALFANLAMLAILISSQTSDGWHNLDWQVAGLTVFTGIVSAVFFVPVVRRKYWQGGGPQPVISS